MAEQLEVLVIGAGQAGLSASYCLTQHGIDHVVLEKDRIGEAWRSGRWDSFTLVTPNWTIRLPGMPYEGSDPDGFMPREEVVAYLERYAEQFNAPLRTGVEVTSVEPLPDGGGYRVKAGDTTFEAKNVIVATGLFQEPKLPAFSADLPQDILQMHSHQYRTPDALPSGAVLVVGSAQSGCQIAEELYESGRKVYLVVGNALRMPRRYRGKDIMWWADKLGILGRTPDKLPSLKARFAGNPHVSGKGGGRTLNLHKFARDGVVLLGRLQGVRDGKIVLAPDLKETLDKVDEFAANLIMGIDGYVQATGMDAPVDNETREAELSKGEAYDEILELDLKAAGITTVIWATGYKFDFSWVQLPVLDDDGFPVQERGATKYPGLYFLGLPWLHTQKSGLLFGVGEDAEHVASHIAANATGRSS